MEDVDGSVDGLAVAVEAVEETLMKDPLAVTAGVGGWSAAAGVGQDAGIVVGLAFNAR